MAMIPAITTGMMDFMMTADDQMVCAGRSDERMSVLAPQVEFAQIVYGHFTHVLGA